MLPLAGFLVRIGPRQLEDVGEETLGETVTTNDALATGTPSATGASRLPANVTDRTVSSAEGPAFGVTRTLTRSYPEKSTSGSASSTTSATAPGR